MASRSERSLRERMPPSLWKISVSLASFTLTFFVTNVFVGTENLIWSLSVGLFIAGLTFVVQFLFDVEEGLRHVATGQTEHVASTTRLIDTRFAQINDATSLFVAAGLSLVDVHAVRELVDGLVKAKQRSPLIRDLTRSEFHRLARFVKEVGEGTYAAYEGEDRDWLLALARLPLATIDAVSIVTVEDAGQVIVDGGPWRSDRARRFFDAQVEAVHADAEPVAVRRIFVVPAADVVTVPGFVELRESQDALGIDTRLLDLSSPAGRQHRNLPEFTLFNDEACYEPRPASRTAHGERPVLISTRLDFDADRIRRRRLLFERLWETAAAT